MKSAFKHKEVIELYISGINITNISKNLGICRRSIYRILRKHNIKLSTKSKSYSCLICELSCTKKICTVCNTNLRRYRVKKQCVLYLGNKCNKCGWSGHLAGYDFHHKNQNLKTFKPSATNLANRSFEVVKKELDNCELLCAICHRIAHSNYESLIKISEIYNGKEFK